MGKSWWMIAFLVVGVLLGAGTLLLVTRPPSGEAVELLPPPTEAPIWVYVTGGVKQAGLYPLPPGSRVNDAIQAGGGFSDKADTTAINLAEPLADGGRIDVPLKITYSPSTAMPTSQSRGGSMAVGLININSATLEQLDTLPEIGPVIGQNIIDYRNIHGPFDTIEEILDVPGIGPVTFSQIKDLITVEQKP